MACNSDVCKFAITVGVGVGVVSATIGLAYLYKKKLENTPPKKWRKVGEISDLICYPIKSCAPIRISKIQCNLLGLEDGNLRDRVFMITNREGRFITARAHPKLLHIQPAVVGDKLYLSAPGMLDFEIDFPHLYTIPPIPVIVWKESVQGVDCGEEAAKWISRFIMSEDTGFRLIFYPNTEPTRNVASLNPNKTSLTQKDSGCLHDATSYMLINENSIAELNSRLDHVVTPLQFRPNFVVKGPLAFEEDSWKWVKIGKEVIFRNVLECTRCILTNINPETAERNPSFQPLKTLQQYRKILPGESPVMGIHLGVRVKGQVSLGDPVYVEDLSR